MLSPTKEIASIEMRLKGYGKVPEDVWIGDNSTDDKVEWLIRRVKNLEATVAKYVEADMSAKKS
jgi:hypothetical protein